MVNEGFVWYKNWTDLYISNWCIFERFKFSNALNNNDILTIFGSKTVKSRKNVTGIGEPLRCLVSLDGIDENKSYEILGVNLHKRNMLISQILYPILGTTNLLSDITRNDMYYCPICMKNGYHSIFHQLYLFNSCVFHPNEKLISSCVKCGKMFHKHSLSQSKNDPFRCKCGNSFLQDINVRVIFNSWKKNTTLYDQNLLDLLKIYQQETEVPIMFHPLKSFCYLYKDSPSFDSNHLIDFTKDLYLNIKCKEKLLMKKEINRETRHSKTVLQSISRNYKDRFSYFYDRNPRSFHELDTIDSVYYDIYVQSQTIYKKINRYLKKEYLKNHLKCIHLNNELIDDNTPCKYAMAYALWREELEEIRILNTHRHLRKNMPKFYFERYTNRFNLYTKGLYALYLEDLLNRIFKECNRDFNQISITQIKELVNTLLPNFLIERFLVYSNLTTNPSIKALYISDLPTTIPVHLMTINKQSKNITLYYKNSFLSLEEKYQRLAKSPNLCGLNKKKKYGPYRTPIEKSILQKMLNNPF